MNIIKSVLERRHKQDNVFSHFLNTVSDG